jgi:hypothetical protein
MRYKPSTKLDNSYGFWLYFHETTFFGDLVGMPFSYVVDRTGGLRYTPCWGGRTNNQDSIGGSAYLCAR